MNIGWHGLAHGLGHVRGYLLAIGVSAALGVLRLLLNPVLHAENPFLLGAIAVLIAAARWGLGPALLAIGIGLVWGIALVPQEPAFRLAQPNGAIRLVFYIAVTLTLVLLANIWRRDRERVAHALRLREDFLRIAAHELNTPLTVVLGNAELLLRRLGPGDPLSPRDIRLLTGIVRQATQQKELIGLLLDISRLERGHLPLRRAPLDVVTLIQHVVEDRQSASPTHHIALRGIEGPLFIEGDAARLEQVVQNLLHNAVKYSPRDGTIEAWLTQEGGEAVLRIRDQGIGIPDGEQAHIFERFYRAGNAASGAITGFGIGLYVVREIVTRHGGSISVHSSEGQGSTFTLRLPCMV
jgi:signal transduction histidine kinase